MPLILRENLNRPLTIEEMDGNFIFLSSSITTGSQGPEGPQGPGIEGTQYILVKADGTDIENAAELQAAYTLATTLSPSATNRITTIAAPGNYNFGTSSFTMNTQYVDLVSLDGNKSIIFNATLNPSNRTQGSINITANNVFVKGVDVLTKNFTIATNLNSLKIENCQGGLFSFGQGVTVSGTFINCQGGNSSFGGSGGNASGTFIDCIGTDGSFGGFGDASGTFTNCIGGNTSFGGSEDGALASSTGVFTNCIGGTNSFGSGVLTEGTYINCIGDAGSFGGNGGLITDGKLYRCQLTSGSFETPTGSGKIVLGIDGDDDVINLP
jgi:hypothetical protein